MDPALSVVSFTIERFEFRGVRPNPGRRIPDGDLPPKLITALFLQLYPSLRNPNSSDVMLEIGAFWLNAGLYRREGQITIDGTIDRQSDGMTCVAFRIVIHDALPEQLPEAIVLHKEDGRGHLGTTDHIMLLAAVEVNAFNDRLITNVVDRLERLLKRLEGSGPRILN